MIQIEHNSDDILRALQQLQGRMTDMSPVMLDIAGVLADASKRAFQSEQDPATGRAWDALTAVTVAMRGGNAHPILQRSGQLAASVTTAYGSDFAEVGTNKVYAAMHQFGGSTAGNSMIPGKTIHARPFLGLGDEDEEEILDIILRYLTTQ